MKATHGISGIIGLGSGLLLATTLLHSTPLSSAHAVAATVLAERAAMVIVPGSRRGPDGRLHDAFTPTDLRARSGQPLIVTVYNYDTGPHSLTAPALHLNVLIPAARVGVPAIRVFTLLVHHAGIYLWHCMQPCDEGAHGWAMSHRGYMAGTTTITRS